MRCIRCGRTEKIERHHIKPRSEGGGDELENKEEQCVACHDYEHTKRKLTAALEKERKRGQLNRIRAYEHRLTVLEELNTPELIRERGSYKTYWEDETTHDLPPRLSKKELKKVSAQFELGLEIK